LGLISKIHSDKTENGQSYDLEDETRQHEIALGDRIELVIEDDVTHPPAP
jgi:hypothetical protein